MSKQNTANTRPQRTATTSRTAGIPRGDQASQRPPIRATNASAARPDRATRLEQAYRRLGTRTPRCVRCHENDPSALQGISPDIICYSCAAREQGKPFVEKHHVAGRHNDRMFTVTIPANDHRVLSDHQRDWEEKTLRNPDGSPALRAGALLCGWLNILDRVVHYIVGWIPPFLEWLDARLTEWIGAKWWITLGWTEGALS